MSMVKTMFQKLYFWVLLGIVSGVVVGHFYPETGQAMKPLGDGFIKLIKMIIAPVIFCTIVHGITGMTSMKNVGRVGLKALIYFEVMTTFALLVGMVMSNTLKPGQGMNIDPATLDAEAVSTYTQKATEQGGITEFVMNIIPTTLFDAFAKGEILQVVFISILVAAGIVALGERGTHIKNLIEEFSDVLFKIIGFIVKLAPIGAFGAMAFTVGKYGIVSLGPLLELMMVFYATCLVFAIGVLGVVLRAIGFNIFSLIAYLKEELLIVLGTSSSEAALPRLIEKMVRVGCPRSIVGLVVPTGYSFNLDGTCIYLTMAALFISQAVNMPLDIGQQIILLSVLLLTSKGAAGVTGSGFIILAASLSTVGHLPVAGLALILGIDRFMSEARALTNFVGNAVATLVVSKWEKGLDVDAVRQEMAKR